MKTKKEQAQPAIYCDVHDQSVSIKPLQTTTAYMVKKWKQHLVQNAMIARNLLWL